MKINLKQINYYCLTSGNKERINQMEREFGLFNLHYVTSPHMEKKHQSGTVGISRILETSICDNNFKKFVILEDDCLKYREFPDTIDIPDDTDILYIGISSWGIYNNFHGINNELYFENINDEIIKIQNMLSTHGMIICSLRGLLWVQKCMCESYFRDLPWDIPLARSQPYYNVYALKRPLVYQSEPWANTCSTKFEFTGNKDNPFPSSLLVKDDFSVLSLGIPREECSNECNSN